MLLARLGIAVVLLAQAARGEEPIMANMAVYRARVPSVTLADNGKTIGLVARQCVEVQLQTQAGSTGYDWYMAHESTPLMKLEGRTLTTPGNAPPGAPSDLVFTLCAVRPGKGIVKFQLYRPWEKNTPPAQTLAVTVKIAK